MGTREYLLASAGVRILGPVPTSLTGMLKNKVVHAILDESFIRISI